MAHEHEVHGDVWPPIVAITFGLFGYGLVLMLKGSVFGALGMLAFIAALAGWVIQEIKRAPLKEEFSPSNPVDNPKLAMWGFLFSEVVFFSSLIGTRFAFKFRGVEWHSAAATLNVPLTSVNTFILICSSLTMALGLNAIRHGDAKKMRKMLAFTALMGLAFVGIKVSEYIHLIGEGHGPAAGQFYTTFFVLTGFHGLHVLAGVVGLAYLIARSYKGHLTAEHHDHVEFVGLYWHFVDIVWIVLFPLIYLLG